MVGIVYDILYKALMKKLHGSRVNPGKHESIQCDSEIDKVIVIDQSPIGKTPRSNPATYTKVFDEIRKIFAQTSEAKIMGYKPGRFSFNVKGGRCEACHGDGSIKIEMNFLPDIYVECEECKHIHRAVLTEEKDIEVPVVISDQGKSKKQTISMQPDVHLNVGEELMVDDLSVIITGIELDSKRVKAADASEITTLWCKRFDKVKLHISIHSGSRTLSRSIFAVPDEEFYIGDIIKSGPDQIAIHKIKTHGKVIKDGGTIARDIVRLYGRFVR